MPPSTLDENHPTTSNEPSIPTTYLLGYTRATSERGLHGPILIPRGEFILLYPSLLLSRFLFLSPSLTLLCTQSLYTSRKLIPRKSFIYIRLPTSREKVEGRTKTEFITSRGLPNRGLLPSFPPSKTLTYKGKELSVK